ncbi:MAG: hypothetical protein MJZ20_07790 [Bacteroidaceae bacterium]|nr:hypothetical protein [Bacteroidaceae bacterium]
MTPSLQKIWKNYQSRHTAHDFQYKFAMFGVIMFLLTSCQPIVTRIFITSLRTKYSTSITKMKVPAFWNLLFALLEKHI